MNDDIHDLSGAYALDALDDLERARFETHLARCPTCQDDVAGFRAAAGHLGRAVSEPPPAAVRGNVLAAIAEIRQERPGAPVPRSRRPSRWVTAAVGLAAAAIIGVLTVQLVNVRDERNEARDLAAVIAAPDAAIMELHGEVGAGRMVWSPGLGRTAIILDGLPDVPDDRGYQLWFVVGGEQIPADVFRPDEHRIVTVTGDLPDGLEVLGFTEEPIGGSPAPTGPMLLTAEA